MLHAISSGQSKAIEDRFAAGSGQGSAPLMQRAGESVAEWVSYSYPDARVVVLAGPGNNGGDGWVAATSLSRMGASIVVCAMRHPDELRGDAAGAAQAAVQAGVAWCMPSLDELEARLSEADVVVDALLGSGIRLPLGDDVRAWCERATACGAPIVAVDLPTGVDTDSGMADPAALAAASTVTFFAPKRGLVLYPGARLAGRIVVDDLGVSPAAVELADAPEIWERADLARVVPLPAADAHKNSRGRLLVIGGSSRFPGAIVLAARGAMRAGAGYVTVAAPEPIVPIVQSHLQAAPVVALPADPDGGFSAHAVEEALELASRADAVVLGPGMTTAEGAGRFARALYAGVRKPLLVDADALNALAEMEVPLEGRDAATILTPHPGELARLLRTSVGDVQSDRLSSSSKLAGVDRVVVLKGAGTVVSGAGRQAIVTSGTPALATAGTGDVLAGVIGALLAQRLDAFDAAVLGAHVHGMAGELAAAKLTPVCVNAEDVPDYLPGAVASVLEWQGDEE